MSSFNNVSFHKDLMINNNTDCVVIDQYNKSNTIKKHIPSEEIMVCDEFKTNSILKIMDPTQTTTKLKGSSSNSNQENKDFLKLYENNVLQIKKYDNTLNLIDNKIISRTKEINKNINEKFV